MIFAEGTCFVCFEFSVVVISAAVFKDEGGMGNGFFDHDRFRIIRGWIRMDEKDLEQAAQTIRSILEKEIRDKYSNEVLKNWLDPQYMGQIERPDGYGKMAGSCGDEMEFFLRVRDEKIVDVRFATSGCITSIASGNMGAGLASGRTISEALMITASDILAGLQGLPPEDEHCAQLATDTIKKAIRDYFLTRREPWRRDY